VSFAAVTLYVASQRLFIFVVYFVMYSRCPETIGYSHVLLKIPFLIRFFFSVRGMEDLLLF